MRRCLGYSVCRCIALFFLLSAWYVSAGASTACGEENAVFKGRVLDVEGNAVEEVKVFVYSSPEVRKTADFISASSDKDGLFRMVLPSGRYWAIARLKKTEGFGPLMPGDRHSGEPTEVELASGSEVNMNFVVADLKEAIKAKTKGREGAVRISGRILDEKGAPVSGAYAIANRNEKISGVPDYLSAWVDSDGRYTLYVPPGKYYIGGAIAFPPGQDYFLNGAITVDGDEADLNIVKKNPDVK
jgi:hypothetical protein